VVIAGGYDVRNAENVEHRAELGRLATELGVRVDFRRSISDAERGELLRAARCVVYTPENEHFGIVPVEAMYVGTPVVACNSGGPTETVVDGVTGFLCEATPEAFGRALMTLLDDPVRAERMGKAAHDHVVATFGQDRLVREWKAITESAVRTGQQRVAAAAYYRMARSLLYLAEALVTLMVCVLLTWLLRQLHVLEPSQSIWGRLRLALMGPREEL
jgi:alpha-1,3/alpha-1,6-mannosyltransferase